MNTLLNFLLNRGDASEKPRAGAVRAPAFSITKVMSIVALILTPVATLICKSIASLTFSAWQVVVLTVSMLAFLATTASVDVLARTRAAANDADPNGPYCCFDPSLKAVLVKPERDSPVDVLAARPDRSGCQLLVREEGRPLTWVAQKDLTF